MKRRDDSGKKKKRMVIIFSLFVVFSMVISIFAIIVDRDTSDTLTYQGKDFTVTDAGYRTRIDGKFMDFYYYPSELERININPDIVARMKASQVIVLLFDPNSTQEDLAFMDVMRYDIQQQIKTPTYFAITNYSDRYQLPVLTCANATLGAEFFLINSSRDTGFVPGENCTIINARLKDILAVKDRMVYSYYGVMQ